MRAFDPGEEPGVAGEIDEDEVALARVARKRRTRVHRRHMLCALGPPGPVTSFCALGPGTPQSSARAPGTSTLRKGWGPWPARRDSNPDLLTRRCSWPERGACLRAVT